MSDVMDLGTVTTTATAPAAATPTAVAATGSTPYDPYQSGPSNSDQWIRRWLLILSGAGGSQVLTQDIPDLPAPPASADNLRMTFKTTQNRVSTPGKATIRVYNTLLTTSLTTLADEYNRVTLSAGYRNGYFGVIFDGAIAYFERGRDDNLVDTYIQIVAQSGGVASEVTTVSQTLAAGRSAADAARAAGQAMAKNGVTFGAVSGVSTVPMPRGQVLYGMATDVLRSVGAKHYVENNVLHIYDPDVPAPGAAFVLNSKSGLVGMPRVTSDGVELTSLINANVKLNSTVQVDQAVINQVASNATKDLAGAGTGSVPVVQGYSFGYIADVAADGLYTVLGIDYEGDTRGQPWYARLICYTQQAVAQGIPGAPGSISLSNPPMDPGDGPTSGQIQTLNAP